MKRLAILLAVAPLAACGLQPLYSGGSSGPVAASLGAIEIAPMPGKAGYLMNAALRDRFGAVHQESPRYRLTIVLDDQIQGFGVRANDTITRERRILRARYQLVDNASGTKLIDATTGSDAGIDVVSSEYAVIAAEDTALENITAKVADQIVAKIALFARSRARAGAR
jgi:LPS-assembly lipoprotein